MLPSCNANASVCVEHVPCHHVCRCTCKHTQTHKQTQIHTDTLRFSGTWHTHTPTCALHNSQPLAQRTGSCAARGTYTCKHVATGTRALSDLVKRLTATKQIHQHQIHTQQFAMWCFLLVQLVMRYTRLLPFPYPFDIQVPEDTWAVCFARLRAAAQRSTIKSAHLRWCSDSHSRRPCIPLSYVFAELSRFFFELFRKTRTTTSPNTAHTTRDEVTSNRGVQQQAYQGNLSSVATTKNRRSTLPNDGTDLKTR